MALITGALVGGGLNMGSQLLAGRTARRGQKQYEGQMDDIISGQQASVEQLLAPAAYQQYLDTAEGRSMLEAAREGMLQGADRAKSSVAGTGGTTEAKLAMTDQLNQRYGDTVNQLAAHGTRYQQGARDRLMRARQGVDQMKAGHAQNLYGMEQQKAANISHAGQGLGQTVAGVGEAMDAQSHIKKLLGL